VQKLDQATMDRLDEILGNKPSSEEE